VTNPFLVAAFGLLWLVFAVYAWSLAERIARLKDEVEDLKARVRERDASSLRTS